MSMIQKTQFGFGAIEAFIILVVLGILGFTGWYIWHAKSIVSKPQVIGPNVKNGWLLYKSTHSTASFQYPSTWKLIKHSIPATDTLKLEDATLLGPNNFTVSYTLSKTYHGRIIYNAACVAPPKVTVLSSVGNKLAISYESYNDIVSSLWLATTGNPPSGYGYATGQCRVRGVDYISIPNDEYITLEGSYITGKDDPLTHLHTADFLNQTEVKTAITIFRSFNP